MTFLYELFFQKLQYFTDLLKKKVLLLVNCILADETCPEDCSMDFDPVCAGPADSTDPAEWIQYSNQCNLDTYNCINEDNRKLSILATHLLIIVRGFLSL